VKVALLGEDGTSYIVEGRAAVEASHDGLAGFRVPADQENDEGLLARMFGVAGLSETTAAGRAIPNDKRGQVDEAEPGARLPLFIEFLPKLAEGGTFCLFSDSLFVRRIDSRFLDRIRVEVGGRTLEEDLKPGAIALRFTGLGIGENEKVKLTLATKRDVHEIAVQRLPAGVLEGSNFDRVARLAKHGCTLQALMAAEGADGKAE
jgi:hypothetical protein